MDEKGGGTSRKKILCDMEKADEINKVLDSISKIEINNTDCQTKLDAIKNIINNSHNTRSMEEICKVIEGKEGGKPKSKSKTKKKKNYKKKTKTKTKKKRKGNKRRKTYKKKK